MNIYPFYPLRVQDRRSVQASGGPIAFIGATEKSYYALSARIGISHPKSTRTLLSNPNLIALHLKIRQRWASLISLIVVETDTTIVTTGKKLKKERRYYLSSKEESVAYF